MQHEVDQANAIITDLLDFSKDSTKLHRETTALNILVNEAINALRTSIQENISIDLQLADALPSLEVDRKQLRRVLDNLLTNATQAMDDGGDISVKTMEQDKSILLEICNTGKGITPENIEKIFDPLFTTRAKGIGLGLTIVKRIIEQHQGDIAVISEPGGTTVFTITLPI